jgi:hypothetical protein
VNEVSSLPFLAVTAIQAESARVSRTQPARKPYGVARLGISPW